MLEIIIASTPLLIAVFIALSRYQKLEPRWLQLFPWFLLLTLIIQITGYYYSAIYRKSNHFIFNLYIPIEYGFYFIIYYKTLNRALVKKWVLFMSICFIMICFYEMIPNMQFFVYSVIASNTGKLLTFCCCLLLLSELLMADELINFFRIPMFWITIGIMVTIIPEFLYLCFYRYISKHLLDPGGIVYGYITTITSILEYAFFAAGFLTNNTWKKLRSS
jgi:hypothetical protein